MTRPSHSGFLLLLLLFFSLACVQLNLAVPVPIAPVMVTFQPTVIPQPTFTPLPVSLRVTPWPACLLPDLEPGQHIAASGSYTETERSASTPMLCHLQRDSCGYNKLVGILDPTIVFKQEETPPFDSEDQVLHPAMLLPLARLNQLVKAEWGGAYQLRVTDAYDSLLEHDPPESNPETRYSLHYEGRAVDLTTWPADYSQYGRLCALAHCAGFDWVHQEGSHCHASIKARSLCEACAGQTLTEESK